MVFIHTCHIGINNSLCLNDLFTANAQQTAALAYADNNLKTNMRGDGRFECGLFRALVVSSADRFERGPFRALDHFIPERFTGLATLNSTATAIWLLVTLTCPRSLNEKSGEFGTFSQ